jgi:hypothetical protein
LSRHDLVASPPKRRPRYLFPIAMAGVFMCAGLFATYRPASADTFSHLPTIDLYPSVNFATGNDEYGSPGGPDPLNNYGPPIGNIASPSAGNAAGGTRPGKLDLNAVISIPIIKALAFQYEHDRCCGIDTTIGRVTGQTPNAQGHNVPTNQYSYPSSGNDIADTYRLVYTGIKGVGVTLATFYRYTVGGGTGEATKDPRNLAPSAWHQQSLTLAYTTPAITAFNGLTLGVSGTLVHNKHHVSGNPNISPFDPANAGSGLANAAAAGYSDTDGKIRTDVNYGPNFNLPINHGFAVFGSESFGTFDFFDNEPVPRQYIITDFGIYKYFNRVLSLTADVNNLVQVNRGGVPFVYPNALHRVYLAIALDIHLAPSGNKY